LAYIHFDPAKHGNRQASARLGSGQQREVGKQEENLMMSKRSIAASLALAAVLVSSRAFGGVIVQNTAGTASSAGGFVGESFTMPSPGGPWNNITFNFFSNVPATTPFAIGTAFLLHQAYLGTPSNLSSATPGFLEASTGITGGMYDFPAALTLNPSVTYFVYENAAIPSGAITGGNVFPGGQSYFTPTASGNFVRQGVANNFVVFGTVPEPSALLVLVSGLLGFGFLRRYIKNSWPK
jgi:PEP-CTERM motif